jgi:hypothetical protein
MTLVAACAAAQRVTLEVPLSPPLDNRAAPVLYDAPVIRSAEVLPLPAPLLAVSASLPALAALPPAVVLPASVLAVAPRAAGAASLPVAAVPSGSAARVSPVTVIDGLREYGGKAEELSGLKDEAGAAALESNFMSAASLGGGAPAAPVHDGSGFPGPAAPERSLLSRLKERVRVDDRGRADEKEALESAFLHLLQTPTGRRYTEEFLAEGLSARVHFADFPESLQALGEARQFTDGSLEVRLNRRYYLEAPAEKRRQNLVGILGHELLGHGLWMGRFMKEDMLPAYAHHESNEAFATLLGWIIEHELNGSFDAAAPWSYLADPARFLKMQKLSMPHYATALSHEQLADPLGALRDRLALADERVENVRAEQATQKTWLPVLEYFAHGHGIPTDRFSLLREELRDEAAQLDYEVANSLVVQREIAGLLGRMLAEPDRASLGRLASRKIAGLFGRPQAEPERQSVRYLQRAARHPLFARLNADVARLSAALAERVESAPRPSVRELPPRPADQISWAELAEMYRKDIAADESRSADQKHWR